LGRAGGNVPRNTGARHNVRMAIEPERHTFLFEPAVWTGSGTLWRADGEPLATHSRTEFVHRPDCWLLSGTLKVLGSPPTEFQQAYLIELPRAPGESLRWTFDSAMFGKLQGRFAVVGSSILAAYGCESSGYYGSEHLGQLDANNYRSVGMLMLKDKLVYSWQTLHKRAPAKV
jgi:hypothetical protein